MLPVLRSSVLRSSAFGCGRLRCGRLRCGRLRCGSPRRGRRRRRDREMRGALHSSIRNRHLQRRHVNRGRRPARLHTHGGCSHALVRQTIARDACTKRGLRERAVHVDVDRSSSSEILQAGPACERRAVQCAARFEGNRWSLVEQHELTRRAQVAFGSGEADVVQAEGAAVEGEAASQDAGGFSGRGAQVQLAGREDAADAIRGCGGEDEGQAARRESQRASGVAEGDGAVVQREPIRGAETKTPWTWAAWEG